MPTALLLPLRAGTDPREKVGCINTMDNKYVADFPTRCRFLTSLKSVFLIGIHVEASGIFLVICERVQTRLHTDSTDEIFLLKGDEWRFFFFTKDGFFPVNFIPGWKSFGCLKDELTQMKQMSSVQRTVCPWGPGGPFSPTHWSRSQGFSELDVKSWVVKLPDLNASKPLVWLWIFGMSVVVGKGEMWCLTLFNSDFHIIRNKLKQTLIYTEKESTKGLRIFLTRNVLDIWRTFVVGCWWTWPRVDFPTLGNHVQRAFQILGCTWLKNGSLRFVRPNPKW